MFDASTEKKGKALVLSTGINKAGDQHGSV
jgi:hypothetical protein